MARIRPPSIPSFLLPRRARAALRLRRGLTTLATLATLVSGLAAAWFIGVRPAAIGRIQQHLGRRLDVGFLRPTAHGFVASGVTVFGSAPFAREPLAFIDRLEIRFGGNNGWLSISQVSADGVDVQLLITAGANNVEGERHRSQAGRTAGIPAAPKPVAKKYSPVFRIRNGRVRGIAIAPSGHRLAFRAANFELDTGQDGVTSALHDVAVEVQGIATARLAHLRVERSRGGEFMLDGKNLSLAVPGARPIVEHLSVEGSLSEAGFALNVADGKDPANLDAAPSPVRLSLRSGVNGIELDASAVGLPLSPLASLVEARGLGLGEAALTASAQATFAPGNPRIPWKLSLQMTGVSVFHPSVDPKGWRGLPLGAQLAGHVDLAAAKVNLEQGSGAFMGVPFNVTGNSELAARPRGKLVFAAPAGGVACDGLLAGQPEPVRENLAGLKLAGRLNFHVGVGFDANDWEEIGLDIRLPRLCTVAAEPDMIAKNRELLVTGGAGRLSHRPALAIGKDNPDFVALDHMPTHLVGAFLSAEDTGFYTHNGFQVEMIRRALAYNLERGRFTKGASTITQQLAKNLFLSHERTLSRKIAETVLTWRLDEIVPKRRVLELYLNIIELGPRIRGVSQAAHSYFGRPLAALRPLESAHLASLPPNPHGYARRFRDGRVDDGWLHRLYDLLATMQRRGHISPADVTAARASHLLLRKI